uniref:oxytocin-neurophysin 1 isoform X1 n=1 Tax=Epinephelus lanceolatus TaxID=310571 RepID=UPI0014476FDE|nr:oxytocin-neurophysin 1 isoform X1 [Epinephelus lanceolatus]
MLLCASACPVALETGAAASAPASAAGRASAACWAPRKQLTAWRRTTCSPPARPEGDLVDLREDAALLQDSAVMQRAAPQTNPASSRRKETTKPANSKAATPVTSSSGSCIWPVTLLLIEFTNELLLAQRSHGKLFSCRVNMGLVVVVHIAVYLCLSFSPSVECLCQYIFMYENRDEY